MLVLISSGHEYLIDILIRYINVSSFKKKVKTLVSTVLPKDYEKYDVLILDENLLRDNELQIFIKNAVIPTILIRSLESTLLDKLEENHNIFTLLSPFSKNSFENILKEIITHHKPVQYPYVNYETLEDDDNDKNKENFIHLDKQIKNTHEYIEKIQENTGIFYEKVRELINGLEDKINQHSANLDQSNMAIYNQINGIKDQIHRTPPEILNVSNSKILRNKFTINGSNIKENPQKIIELLSGIIEETRRPSKAILMDHCFLIMELIFGFHSYFSRNKYVGAESFNNLTFEISRCQVEENIYVSIYISKIQEPWHWKEFLFLKQNYIYEPILDKKEKKLKFAWNI